MWIDFIVVIVILGLAFLIRSLEESSREFKRPFLLIVAFFIVLYICAGFFLSYRIGAWGAVSSSISSRPSSDASIIDEPVTEVDLSPRY